MSITPSTIQQEEIWFQNVIIGLISISVIVVSFVNDLSSGYEHLPHIGVYVTEFLRCLLQTV